VQVNVGEAELDYELLEQGVPPSEALESGREGS